MESLVAKLGSSRPVKARSFALENLERRLLLDGNFTWANPAGGDYNYGSNWVGGVSPNDGSNITIGALNPGAHVDFHGNTATLASVTISANGALIVQSGSLTVTQTLSVATGGSLSVTGSIRSANGDGSDIPSDAAVIIAGGATMNVNGGTVSIEHRTGAGGFFPVIADGTLQISNFATLAVSNGGTINLTNGYLRDYGTVDVAVNSSVHLSGAGYLEVSDIGVLNSAGTAATSLSLANQAILSVNSGGALTANAFTASNTSSLQVENYGSQATLNGVVTLNDSSAFTIEDALLSVSETGSLALHSYAEIDNYGGTLHLSGPTTSDGPTSYIGYGKLILGSNANPTGPPVDFGSSFSVGSSGSVEGWGTITAQTIDLAGTISPGGEGQIGTLGFSSPGSISQQPETLLVFEFEIGAAGADQVHFTSTDAFPGLLGFYSPTVNVSYVDGFSPTAAFTGTTNPLVTLTNIEVGSDDYNLPEYGLFGQVNTVFGDATHPGLDILTGSDASMSVKALIPDTGSTFTYIGPNHGSVSDSGNWSGGQLPTFGSNVVIPAEIEAVVHSGVYEAFNTITVNGTLTSKTTHASILLGGAGSTVNNLNFTNQEGAYLTVQTGATLTVTGTAAFDNSAGLVVNGTLRLTDSATVANENHNQEFGVIINGTLAGTGTFEGDAEVFGLLAPGGVSTVGTLTFTDHLWLENGASLVIRLADANVSDQVVALGDVSLSYTTLDIQLLNSGVTGYTVNFLTAAYDIGGIFGVMHVTGPGSAGLPASVSIHYESQVTAVLVVGSGDGGGPGGGSESTLSTTLRAGLPDLQTIVRQFGPFFNLGAINYAATGATQPNLAVLPAALDSLFGISGLLSSASLPTISATADNNALVAALIGAGFTVEAIAGGATYNATVIPDVAGGSGLQIQVHYTTSLLSSLTVSGSYSGNTLNDTTPNLLQGLASSLSLSGAINWTGSLGLSLVFGVDASGFFIAPSSALVLSAAGTGTVSGTGTIGGKNTISLTGTGGADLRVNLELGASGTPYRVGDLNGHLADKLVPLIAGTAGLSVNATVGPLSLTYAGNYTQTADLAAHTQTFALASAVTGTLTIPGLKTSTGDPAALPVTGTFDSGSNSWTLTVSATDLRFSGLTVTSASFSITLSAAAFTGSGAMNLEMTFFTSSATPVTLALQASFDADTGTFGTDVVPPDVTVLNNQGGTLLTTTNVHITATLNVDFGAGTLTGSMSLTAGGGTLTAFTLSNATHPTQPAVSLSYDFATQIIALSIDTLSVGLNHGFSLTVAGLGATYDRANNDPNQVLATVVNVTVKLGALNGPTASGPPAGPDPSLTVSSLTLTQTGFSLSDSATVLDAHVGSFLSLNSAGVSLSGVGYDASGYHGSIMLSATAGQLYPGQNLITASVGATTGSFDLATQAFSLTANHLSLAAGSAFVVSADGVALHYDPAATGAQVFATLATATATSTQLSSMGSATLSGLQLSTDGVSFGSFSFGQHPGDPNPVLGSILELVNPTVSVTGFSFTYGAASSAGGTVGFMADSAKLYPAAGAALTSSLTGVAGSYDFASPGATGALNLTVASLSLTVANALTIAASNVTLSPDAMTIATIAHATVTSSTLAGLGSATLDGFELTRDGFTIHTATLSQPPGSTATFGSVLSLTDASITVSELSYSTTATNPFGGMMSLGFGAAALFPSATGFLSTTLTAVSATFDLSGPSPSGHLNFTVGTFALRVGDAFVVTASNVTLTPAETTIATITSATLSSPLIDGLPTAALTSLVITQNGFSVADFTLAQAANATVTIGPALSLTGAALKVEGFAYDATNSANPVSGTVTLTITGAALFSDQSVFTTTLTGVSASFGFGGAAPHGALSITVGAFSLKIGEALQVTASNVALTPSAPTLLALATATVSSPTITNLASATLTDLAITQTGFSLGSFSLAQTGGPARIGNVLSLTGASLVVSDLNYDSTRTSSPINGSIALTVASASLYPDATAFSSTLGNLVASYLLGGADPTGRLSIAVGSFTLKLGEALRITASDLTLTPGATTIATIGTATLTSPLITGLASATLSGFLLTQSGFSIGTLTLAASSAGTPARIGDFLALTNASLQVTGFSYDSTNSAHPIAGAVALSFDEVHLYPDSTAFTTILTGGAASYDFSQTGSLQITATAFELKIGEAIELTAGALTITPGQDTLFTLATAAITSPQFPAFNAGAISQLVVKREGFSLGSFSFGGSGQQVDFGNFLRLDGATFTATDFAVSYGAGGTTFAGTIGLGATGISLFPGSDLFHTTVGNFTMSYDFRPGADGALHIHAGSFTLTIGQVLQVSASNVEIRPGQEIMFTLDNATVSSPQFTDFDAAQVSDLEFRQDGFRLGSFSLGTAGGQVVNFGSVLQLTGATFKATDFAVTYGATTTVSGTIGLAATDVSLFPNSNLFTTKVENFTMHYALGSGGDGALHIHAGTFTLSIGEAVQVTANDVEIAPGEATMFRLASATISSPQFTDFAPGTITDLEVTQTGFSLGSFSLGTTAGQEVNFGSFLRLNGAKLTVSDFVVTYGTTTTVSGTIGLIASGLQLFPGSGFLTTTVTGLDASYDYSPGATGALSIHVDTFELKIGEALDLAAGAVTITPGQDIIMTLGSALVTSPSLTGFGSLTLSNFIVHQDGFSFGQFTLGQGNNQTVDFGSVLELQGAVLTVDNFKLSLANNVTTIDGTIGLTATSVTLFPGATFFTIGLAGLHVTYDLGSNAGTGALNVSVADFSLQISNALVISAHNIVITPGRSTILTIGSATVTSPAISGISGSIAGFELTQSGFSIGSLDLSPIPGSEVKFGTILTFSGITIGVRNFVYDSTHNTLAGTITVGASSAVLFPGNGTFTATVTTITGGYTLGASGFAALSLSIGGFSLQLGTYLTVTGTNLVLTPESDTVLTVGSISATVTVGAITIGGTASNFALTKSGGFTALAGFGVTLDLNTDTGSLKWPSWLPIHITALGLHWADVTNHPLDFAITLSASVTSLNGLPFGVTGSINGLVLDLGELSRGNFPITDLGSASITVDGTMFGGHVHGSLVLGLVKLDAADHQILVGDTTTPVAQRVLYGGIHVGLSFLGISGFDMAIGISELGPLSIYVSAGIPILLDPNSGLSLTNFFAGVVFNTSLPSVSDPKALRGSAFQTMNKQTDAEWVAQLELSVVNQAHAMHQPNAPPSAWNVFSQPMLIEGGVTLFSAYTSTLVFHADVSIIISTDGKFLVSGSLVFGDSLTVKGSIYADLSAVRSGTAKFLFLLDAPAESPVLSIYGGVLFAYVRNDGTAVTETNQADTFTITFIGGVDFSAGGLVNASVTGFVELAFGPDRFDLKLHGAINLPLLGDALGVDGSFHLTTGSGAKFWGALVIQPNFTALTELGLTATGIAILRVNSTADNLSETLTVPGQANPAPYDLAARSVSVLLQGTVGFSLGGADWFNVTGTWAMELTPTRLSVLGIGTLNVGPAGSPFIVYNYNGFFQIDATGVAATLGVTQTGAVPGAPPGALPGNVGLALTATWQVTLNTTGHDVTFTLPPGTAPINGATSFTITGAPAAAPDDPTVYPASSYLEMVAVGDLNVLNSFTLHGTFFFLLAPGVLELTASATLSLTAGSATILGFNVSGGIKIDATGAVAVLDLALDASVPIPANLGLSISGSFELQLNTTNAGQTVAGVALEAGSYVRVIAFNARLLELGVSLTGSFSFTSGVVNGLPTLEITADATLRLNVGGSSGLTLFSFTVKGGLLIDADGIAAYFGLGTGSGLGAGDTLGYQFLVGATLEINTTGKQHTFTTSSGTATLTEGANHSTTAGNYAEVDLSGQLIVSGLTLTGDFFVGVTPTALTIYASATLALQVGGSSGANLFNFSVTGGLVINSSGLAGYVTLATGVNSTGSSAYSFSVDATLEINTTGAGIDVATATGSRHLTGGANGLETGGAYAEVWLHGALTVSALAITGDFYASVNASSLTIYASATVALRLGGTSGTAGVNLFNFAVTGGLVINTSGLAGYVALATGATSTGSSVYSFSVDAVLEINTTGGAVDVPTAAGPQHLYAGVNHLDASPGAYAEVWLHGSLNVSALVVTGEFYASVNASSLTIYASAALTLHVGGTSGTNLFTFAVTGGLVINTSGLAGYVTLATGVTSNVSNYGFGVDATLEINTMGAGVDVATSAGTKHLYAGVNHLDASPGAYAEVWLHGSLTVSALVITGDFYASVNASSLTIYASATVALKLGGATGANLFSFAVTGGLVINTSGLAGYVALATGATSTGSSAYSFSADATLQINTTGAGIDVATATGTQHLTGGANGLETGGAYAQVLLHGSLTVSALVISGDFYASVNASSLTIYASATVKLQMGGASGRSLFSFAVTGGLVINTSGLAGYVALATGATSSGTSAYSFSVDAVLEINTTGSALDVATAAGTKHLNAGANHSDASAGAYAQVWLHGSLTVSALVMTGEFYASVNSTGLTIYASATLKLQVGGTSGTSLFTFSVTGGLVITTTGLAGYVALATGASSTGVTGYSFGVDAVLEINTTGSGVDVPVTSGTQHLYAGANHSDATPGAYAEVWLHGALTVGALVITGEFYASASATSLTIYASATLALKVGGTSGATLFTLTATGGMTITTSGLAAAITLGVTAGAGDANYSFANISATLAINTTGSHIQIGSGKTAIQIYAGANHQDTTPGAYAEVDLNGLLTVGGLTLSGDFYVSVSASSLTIYAVATLALQVGGTTLLTFSLNGGMVLSTRGIAAYLTAAVGGRSTSNAANYQFSVSATVTLNTTSGDVAISPTKTVSGTPTGVTPGEGTGTPYAQVDMNGALKVGGLTLVGDFFVSVTASSLTIYVQRASVTLATSGEGTTLFTFVLDGGMVISTAGVAAYLSLDAEGQSTASLAGYQFKVGATVTLNTTSTDVQLTPTKTISGTPTGVTVGKDSATPYAQVDLYGSLKVGGLTLTGNFYVTVSTKSLTIYADATVTLLAGGGSGTTLFTLSVTGAMLIDPTGIAAYLSMAVGTSASYSSTAYQFSIKASVQLNTTHGKVKFGAVEVTAGAAGAATGDTSSYAQVDLHGTLTVSGLVLDGDFFVSVSETSLAIYASALLTLRVGGSGEGAGATLLSFTAKGGMVINTTGVAAFLTVTTGTTKPEPTALVSDVANYRFNVTATVTINTTRTTIAVDGTSVSAKAAGTAETSPAAAYAQVDLNGSLAVSGLTVTGDFFISVSATSLAIYADATLTLAVAGTTIFTLDVTGAMRISTAGLAAYITVGVSGGAPTSAYAFAVTGILEINTTPTSQSFVVPTGKGTATKNVTLEAGIFARVAFHGTLTVGGLVMTGDFTVTAGTYNGVAILAIDAEATLKLTAGGTTIFTLTVDGGMRLSADGLAAYISLTLGDDATDGLGFAFAVTATLEINTTATGQGFPVPLSIFPYVATHIVAAHSADVFLSGSLTVGGLVMTGGFTVTIGTYRGASTLEVSAHASLALALNGIAIFTLDVQGGLRITSGGIAAYLAVGFSGGAPTGFGFAFAVSAILELNTTASGQDFPATVPGFTRTVAAHTADVYLNGTLTVGGMSIIGTFTVTTGFVGSQATLEIVADAKLALTVDTVTVFNFIVKGDMRIGFGGIAANITLGVSGGSPYGLGFGFSVTANLQVNNTRRTQTLLDGSVVSAVGLGQISLFGTLNVSGLIIFGTFTVTVGSGTLEIYADATLSVNAGSTTVLSFHLTGALRITAHGIASDATITLNAGVPSGLGFGFTFLTRFQLQINTTGDQQTFTYGDGRFIPITTDIIPTGPYARLSVFGEITLGGFSLAGGFTLTVTSSSISVSIQAVATLPIFGTTGILQGTFTIYGNGIVIGLNLSLPTIQTSFFTLSGTFGLQVDTRDNTNRIFLVSASGVSLKLLGFSLSGSLSIGVVNGYFLITVKSTDALKVTVLGLATITVSGYVRSDGLFSLTGSIALGSGGNPVIGNINVAALKGTLGITIDQNSGFHGTFSGDLWVFGYNVGQVSLNTTISATPFTYTAPVTIHYDPVLDLQNYLRYPGGQLTYTTFPNTYFVVTAHGTFSIPGIGSSLTGDAVLAVGPSGLSGRFSIAGSIFGLSASAVLLFMAPLGYWQATVTASYATPSTDIIGVAVSVSATITSDHSFDRIILKGAGWASWHGLGVNATLTGIATLDGHFTLDAHFFLVDVDVLDLSLTLNLGSVFSWASDLSGGYAFIDTTGNGVWDATMARVPVAADGSFDFSIGDPTQWQVDSTHGYAFRDTNGNGVWDEATEAYVPLKADGSLPDAIARLLDPTVDLLAGAPDAGSLLGLLRNYAVVDANGDLTPVLNTYFGHIRATGGNRFNADGSVGAANTGAIDLNATTTGYTGLSGAGQVVFFDTNGNGALDPGEVSVLADVAGFYTFAPDLPHHRPLGLLAGFDRNGSGVIDDNEGTIVLTGATDRNNGVVTSSILRMSGSQLDGISTAISPISTLRNAMVNLGATVAQAYARIAFAFQLPTTIDLSSFVPSDPSVSDADRSAVLRATTQIETLLLNSASLLSAASHGTLTAAAAQQIAVNQLAVTLMSSALTPPAGDVVQTRPALDLTDVPTLNAFFATVAATAHVTLDSTVIDAVARITSALNLAAAGYAAAAGDPTRQLARIDALTEGRLIASLGDLATGRVSASSTVALYTGTSLTNLLNAVVLTPVVAPTVVTPDDVSVQGGTAIAPIVLEISSATAPLSHLTVSVTSSNAQLLPSSGMAIVLSGGRYLLFLQAAVGQVGTSTLTLSVSDGSLITTRTFQVTVTSTPVNTPVFTTAPVTNAFVGQTYSYGINVSSSDPARTFVIAAGQTLPTWLTLTDNGNGTAMLTGVAPDGILGPDGTVVLPVSILVTDDQGSAATQTFNLVVSAQPTDGLSINVGGVADTTVGTPLILAVSAAASEGAGALHFSVPGGLPAWLTLQDNGDGTALLLGTPGPANTGQFSFTVAVTDDNGQVATRSVAFAVTSAQGIAPVSDQTLLAGTNAARTLGLTLTGVDAGTTLTVSSNNPTLIGASGLVLHGTGSHRTLTLTPQAGTIGNATITLTVLENGVASATITFQFVVTSPLAPAIAPVGNVTLPENANGTINLTLSGIDGAARLTVASGNPALIDASGLLLGGSGNHRTLTFTPHRDATGTTTITLTLTDGGLVATLTFQLTITPVDHPVTVLGALPAFVVGAGSGAITIDLSHYFSNVDGTTTYALGRNTDAALLGARIEGNQLILTPAAARAGLAALDIIASSTGAGTGAVSTASGTVHLTVLPDVLLSGPAYLRLANGSIVARFTVTLSVVSNQGVRVAYGTADGTARSGFDYTGAQGYVDIAAGALSATIDIGIAGTSLYPNLDFTLGLNSALSALLQDRTNAHVAIPVDRAALFGQQGGATVSFGLVVSFLTAPGGGSLDYLTIIGLKQVQVMENFTPSRSGGPASVADPGISMVAETSLAALATPHQMTGYGKF